MWEGEGAAGGGGGGYEPGPCGGEGCGGGWGGGGGWVGWGWSTRQFSGWEQKGGGGNKNAVTYRHRRLTCFALGSANGIHVPVRHLQRQRHVGGLARFRPALPAPAVPDPA